jgi:hypothetical protein
MVVLPVKKIVVLACEKGLMFLPIPDPGGLYKVQLFGHAAPRTILCYCRRHQRDYSGRDLGRRKQPYFWSLLGQIRSPRSRPQQTAALTSHDSLQSPITDAAGTATNDPAKMIRISLDSYNTNRAVMYAAAG